MTAVAPPGRRHASSGEAAPKSYATLVAVGVVLGGVMLAIGGIHPAVALVFGVGAAFALALLLALRRAKPPSGVPLVAVAFFFLAVATAASCVPVPLSLLRLLAPDNAEVWSRALAPINALPPALATISLAPELSLVEAVKWAAYGALAWIGHEWSKERGLGAIAALALGLALLAAVVTVVHGLLEMKTVYGFYVPSTEFPRWRVGPLLNSNHLAGYLMLGAFSGLALLLSNREPPTARTALVLGATVALVLGVVLLGSRAALVVLIFGALCLPLTLLQKKRPSLGDRSGPALGLAALLIGVGLAVAGYSQTLVATFSKKDWSKLHVAKDSLPLIRQHWLTGVGRGAFEGVFFAYRSETTTEFWSHPENIAVQWLSEWGLPISAVGAGLMIVAIARAPAWRSSVIARVLLLGLLVVTTQNLLDFSLELPAVAGLAALLLGAVTGAPGSGRSHRRAGAPRRGLAMGVGLFSPPFGIGYYGACAIGKCRPEAAALAIMPYLLTLIAALAVIAAVPWLSIGLL